MTELRQYQKQAISDIKKAFTKSKRVFLCLPTGAGKTVIFSEIAKSAVERGRVVWEVVPRDTLIWQASEKLLELGVRHGIVAPHYQESINYRCHVVSKDTWIRRKEKIKTPPDFIIVDEGHIATTRYEDMIETYPNAWFLFVSATPERLDGKSLEGLAPESSLVYGPSIHDLISHQYLSPMEYYCPPVAGLDKLKHVGTEIDPEQLEQWLAEHKTYGKALEHYRLRCHERQSIIYCRNVKSAKETADKWQEAGYKIESVDGTMAKRSIRNIIQAVKDKQLDGVSSCDLITYGLDVPNVSAIIMLRPTLSRALYFQMMGRGLRYEPGKVCIMHDHVGNARRHCSDRFPWEPVEWNYCGRTSKNKSSGSSESIKYCPYLDFMPCDKPTCVGCNLNPEGKPIKDWEEVDGQLVAMTGEIPIKERPNAEKKHYSDKLQELKSKVYNTDGSLSDETVKELVTLAKETDRKPIWIYFFVTGLSENTSEIARRVHVIDDLLLDSIRRHSEYKQGWLKFAKKIILGEKIT